MEYIFNDKKYKLEKDEDQIFDYEEIKDKITSYFDEYDYILGDMSYGKIRLKGFCDKDNKIRNKINAIDEIDNYIKNYCAYGCSFFLLNKMKQVKMQEKS